MMYNTPSFLVRMAVCTELEWKLSEIGAVKTDIEENPWKKRQIRDALTVSLSGNYRDPDDSDEDSSD